MPGVVITLSPFFTAASISCTFLRCRCCGKITRKYMIPNMSARGIRKPPSPEAPPACQKITAARFMFGIFPCLSGFLLSRPDEATCVLHPGPREKNTTLERMVSRFYSRPILGWDSTCAGCPRPAAPYNCSERLASGWARQITDAQLCSEICKLSKTDSLSDLPHYVKVKVDIMMGRKDRRSDLTRGEEMPKIRARVTPAHRATAFWVDGPLVLYIPRVLDQHPAFTRIQARVTRRPRRQHAIHHVNAARHVIRNLLRPSNSHEITRPSLRQQRRNFFRHLAGDFVRLSHGQSAHRITGKFNLQKLPRALPPQIGERRPLHDTE